MNIKKTTRVGNNEYTKNEMGHKKIEQAIGMKGNPFPQYFPKIKIPK